MDAEAALLHPRAYRFSTFELQPTPKLQPKLKLRGRIRLSCYCKKPWERSRRQMWKNLQWRCCCWLAIRRSTRGAFSPLRRNRKKYRFRRSCMRWNATAPDLFRHQKESGGRRSDGPAANAVACSPIWRSLSRNVIKWRVLHKIFINNSLLGFQASCRKAREGCERQIVGSR